jgi:hypothetical protein
VLKGTVLFRGVVVVASNHLLELFRRLLLCSQIDYRHSKALVMRSECLVDAFLRIVADHRFDDRRRTLTYSETNNER